MNRKPPEPNPTSIFRLEEMLRQTLIEADEHTGASQSDARRVKIGANTHPLTVRLSDGRAAEFFATYCVRPDGSGDLHLFFKQFRTDTGKSITTAGGE
jgi:hypothetical protein